MISDAMLVIQLVASALKSINWTIREQGEIATEQWRVRPDLVVTGPSGKVFLIELKEGREPMHFATLAQLERTARLLSKNEEEVITPVLLTGQDISPKISEIADQVGVHVVKATGTDKEAAESIVQFLQRAE